MLELDDSLPPGARLNGAGEELAAILAAARAFWFSGRGESFVADAETGVVSSWEDAGGSALATPAAPNDGNGRIGDHEGRLGLQGIPGENCGLVVEKITENASRFSMAVIYRPPAEDSARTLLTVNTGYSGGDDKTANYLFLSDGGDAFTVKDTKGALDMTQPVFGGATGARLALVTLLGDRLALQQDQGPIHEIRGADPGMHSRADLFIGCRSHRRGLQKTLGGALVHDVIFWPDHTLLLPRSPADRAQHRALQRYVLGEY